MIAWSLAEAGYTTGLFTSPSIHRITERLRINGLPISEPDFTGLVEGLWPAVEKVAADGDIGVVSVFELETAMAFCHFSNSDADISVIEVGLGGRFDSTNIITPILSVITPISLDHVAVLGDTIAQIAGEKAGIIKPGIPAVTAPQKPEALEVIRATAKRNQSLLIESKTSVDITCVIDLGLKGIELEFSIDNDRINTHLNLLGDHQIDNSRTAIAALIQLNNAGIPVGNDAIGAGLKNVKWTARNQLVASIPTPIFVDGAHNDASALALLESVTKLFPNVKEVFLILGTVRGHKSTIVAQELSPLLPRIIVTQSRHPKSLTNLELSSALGESKIPVLKVTNNTLDALKYAKETATASDVIIATGSLFVAAEIIEIEQGIEPELYPDIKLPPRL
jgi:dihydrofolate synthase/folylpolyglutamate synthase